MSRVTDLRLDDLLGDPLGSAGVVLQSVVRNLGTEWQLYAVIAGAVIVAASVDLFQRRASLAKYGSRNARTDLLHGLVEMSHIHVLILMAPVAASLNGLVDAQLPWLRLADIAQLPLWAMLIVGLLATDFACYWLHRLKHANRWLWQFHKVHHSQEQLTVLTFFRFPIVDRFLDFLFLFPLGVVTGSAEMPVALLLLRQIRSLLEHSGLDWDYGIVGRVIVSPAYHSVHHSRAPEHIDRNFGILLTVWDRLFRTRAERGPGPIRYGLAHEYVPECFWRQNLAPFVGIVRLIRNQPFPLPPERPAPPASSSCGVSAS